MQFGSGVLGVEPPVDGGSCRIALGLVGVDRPLQSGSYDQDVPLGYDQRRRPLERQFRFLLHLFARR